MKVVVGLGNPGPKYVDTRHNVGYEVIDYLAASPMCGPFRNRFQSLLAEMKEDGEQVLLVKPETFMNLSGRAVQELLAFYKLEPADLLVLSDDLNLPLGKLRARPSGSHGGQNGLRNIQQQLGTDQYARLRLGIGSPRPGEAIDFVLSRFKPAERKFIDDAVAKAAQGVLIWVKQGIGPCMNLVNGEEKKEPEKKKPRTGSEEKKKDDGAT